MNATIYQTRYNQLTEQRAYERRVHAFGLPALLAPYRARIPEQRGASEKVER